MVGHAWRAGRGRWGTRSEGREEKGEREKEGAGFAAAGHDASRWRGKEMGRELNSGVGLFRRNSRARVQGLRGVELNGKENSFSARFNLVDFRDVTAGR